MEVPDSVEWEKVSEACDVLGLGDLRRAGRLTSVTMYSAALVIDMDGEERVVPYRYALNSLRPAGD